jgi:flagellar biosynthesis/type III secretory pathway M-ring protein FliF/YscJ
MNSETLNIAISALLILLVIFIFIRIALRIRKRGGSLTTTMFASTYEFLNKDKREAVEEIVEVKANKKMEEESSDKPEDDI